MFDDSSKEAYYSRRRFLSVVPVFESENERKIFEKYIINDISNISEELHTLKEDDYWEANDSIQKSLNIGKFLVKKLKIFRMEKR